MTALSYLSVGQLEMSAVICLRSVYATGWLKVLW